MTHDEDRTRGFEPPAARATRFKLDNRKRGLYFACKKFAKCASDPIPRAEYNSDQPPDCETHHDPMIVHVEPA